jgi:hypothetical protein
MLPKLREDERESHVALRQPVCHSQTRRGSRGRHASHYARLKGPTRPLTGQDPGGVRPRSTTSTRSDTDATGVVLAAGVLR